MNLTEIGIVVTIVSALTSGLVWLIIKYVDSEKKAYAAEREFNHIKNSLKTLNENLINELQNIDQELDKVRDELKELRFVCQMPGKKD